MIELKLYLDPDQTALEVAVTQGSYLVEGDDPDDSHLDDAGLDSAAIDLGLAPGTRVHSFAVGRVVGAYAGYTDASFPTAPTTGPATFGNYVTVEYQLAGAVDPFYVTFAHLSQASAAAWVDALNVASGPVTVAEQQEIGLVADATDTPYPPHLHLSFATSYGNYASPNGVAIATATPDNAALLAQLSIDGQDLSAIAAGDSVTGVEVTTESLELTDAAIIEIGMAMARAVYGGSSLPADYRGEDDKLNYYDDYRGYVSSLSTNTETWLLLGPDELGMSLSLAGENFTDGGLYRSGVGWFGDSDSDNVGEALVAERVVGGVRTIVIAFRGSDGADAFYEGQTFTNMGLDYYYEGMRPLINAVFSYIATQQVFGDGVDNVIVSGHSLGGTIVDLFARMDADLFGGTNLSLVSVASAGLPSEFAALEVLPEVDNYIGISHSEDRVHYPNLHPSSGFEELTPTWFNLFNVVSPTDILIDLPNLTNVEVIYDRPWYNWDHGFGAEHNGQLYWANLRAITSDPLFEIRSAHQITLGLTDYSSITDLNGSSFELFQSYTGISNANYMDDAGERALKGGADPTAITSSDLSVTMNWSGGRAMTCSAEAGEVTEWLEPRESMSWQVVQTPMSSCFMRMITPSFKVSTRTR